jgi:hypothetical protein
MSAIIDMPSDLFVESVVAIDSKRRIARGCVRVTLNRYGHEPAAVVMEHNNAVEFILNFMAGLEATIGDERSAQRALDEGVDIEAVGTVIARREDV